MVSKRHIFCLSGRPVACPPYVTQNRLAQRWLIIANHLKTRHRLSQIAMAGQMR